MQRVGREGSPLAQEAVEGQFPLTPKTKARNYSLPARIHLSSASSSDSISIEHSMERQEISDNDVSWSQSMSESVVVHPLAMSPAQYAARSPRSEGKRFPLQRTSDDFCPPLTKEEIGMISTFKDDRRSSDSGCSTSDWKGNPKKLQQVRPTNLSVIDPHHGPSRMKAVCATSEYDDQVPSPSVIEQATPAQKPTQVETQPTFALLFELSSRTTQFTVLVPAILLSVICGLIPPYMTELLGKTFQHFIDYSQATLSPSISHEAIQSARAELLRTIRLASIQFTILAGIILVTSSASITLWVIFGERTARALRLEAYKGISMRDLEWFDLGMGNKIEKSASKDISEGEDRARKEEDSKGGEGSGGLMGRFTKDTDDVRVATSQSMGLLCQYFTSFLACLVLSLVRNYQITFVVLASVPVITVLVGFTDKMAAPFVNKDRTLTARSANRVDRIMNAMPTVKAFNAQETELNVFRRITESSRVCYNKMHFIWGWRQGIIQFLLLAMFVQGFWFGNYLINKGRATPAEVSTCFWACLLASTFLQLCVPMLVVLEKGKVAMAGLLDLARQPLVIGDLDSIAKTAFHVDVVDPKTSLRMQQQAILSNLPLGRRKSAGSYTVNSWTEMNSPSSADYISPPNSAGTAQSLFPQSPRPLVTSPTYIALPLRKARGVPTRRRQRTQVLRKLRPLRFTGELGLRNVTFYYPSRRSISFPVLKNVSMYLAASETTFIIGPSGSGKSTIASLLLGLYRPEIGHVEVDEQSLEWIDKEWLRSHVASVSQGVTFIFHGTVHDNVAIGVAGQIQADGRKRKPEEVTREEVIAACRGVLLHDFVKDLPEGYDTWLSGERGTSLSGGQSQRLGIARAWIRDATVLILDEALSALDPTSRLLIAEALKRSRRNRTTIIITHDLTMIDGDEFVYVMKEGEIVEEGYRRDLEGMASGCFQGLRDSQDLPVSDTDVEDDAEVLSEHLVSKDNREWRPRSIDSRHETSPNMTRSSSNYEMRSLSSKKSSNKIPPADSNEEVLQFRQENDVQHASHENDNVDHCCPPKSSRSSIAPSSVINVQSKNSTHTAGSSDDLKGDASDKRPDSSMSFSALDLAAKSAARRRVATVRLKHKTLDLDGHIAKKWNAKQALDSRDHTVDGATDQQGTRKEMTTLELTRRFYPIMPSKSRLFLGLFISVAVGSCTPVFSTLLAKIMANLGNPNAGSLVTRTSLLILLVAALEGVGGFAKFYLLESCAMQWIAALRVHGFSLILKQDKAWFDKQENASSAIVHSLVKDSEDARALVGTIVGQLLVVISMTLIGMTWAFVVGWELTLVGLVIAPAFALATKAQASVLNKFEAKNRSLREEVSRRFHQAVANIRAIRSMSLESIFTEKFEAEVSLAYAGGARSAPFTGLGFALGSALTYLCEAIMFYVGALLIVDGRYSFAKMTEVFTLIIFSLTFSAQILAYLPAMAKSVRASIDIIRLLDLSSEPKESEGRMTYPMEGSITFNNVKFAYPERDSTPILKGMSFTLQPGECVGIVGASGSGKSTILSLVQRLYEPDSGSIAIDGRLLERTDVKYLRNTIAVVSQHPALFDMTVSENIAYGCESVDQEDVIHAAKLAHIHDYIVSLPHSYQTMLGENSSLFSGGQAQRLQIARALFRPRKFLLLDECTSALDSVNQAAVMETINHVKKGRTTMIVTHKLAVMETCDRLLVVEDGTVVESGAISELRERGGLFAQLANGGEWESS